MVMGRERLAQNDRKFLVVFVRPTYINYVVSKSSMTIVFIIIFLLLLEFQDSAILVLNKPPNLPVKVSIIDILL